MIPSNKRLISPHTYDPSDLTMESAAVMARELVGPWFCTLAASMHTGVILLSAGGLPVYASASACELFDLRGPDDHVRPSLEQLQELIPSALRKSSETNRTASVDVELPSGTRSLVLRNVPIEGGRRGTLVLVEDRARLEALETSLTLANRMRTQSSLRSQAHDLKAPLNALVLHLELLRKSLAEETSRDEERRERHLNTTRLLQREIARLDDGLERFLEDTALSGQGSGRQRRFEACELVLQVIRLVRPRAKALGVELAVDVAHSPAYVVGDSDLLQQALLNLVLNAFEAQPNGGRTRLIVSREDECVRIDVEDEGPGIPEAMLGHVFEMNFTTKKSGTGIGLTVARSLVEGQGGRLRLSSENGEGTRVQILLPESITPRSRPF